MKITKTIVEDFKGVVTSNNPELFDEVLNHLTTLKFLAGSHHDCFRDYYGKSQGGYNLMDLKYIEIIHESDGKITVKVSWDNDGSRHAILIFRQPKSIT